MVSRTVETPKLLLDKRRWRLQLGAAAIVWSLLIASVLVWSLGDVDDEMLGLARQEAIANFNKDQAFRIWGNKHGGVYVPVGEHATPNPFLNHFPARDVVTTDGRKLTLINPASMLLQIMQDYDELYGLKGKITSHIPLNPANFPDEWESAALKAFESGEEEERLEVTVIDGKPFLRLIRPMVTREGCLNCHGHQPGYKVGGIQGGVGVSVPLESYYALAAERKLYLWMTFGGAWLIGIGVIGVAGRYGRQRIYERINFEERIWHQANIDVLTKIPNRNLFMDRMEHAIAQARRDKMQVALLFIDLDRFKDVNDTRGHAVGDRLLQEAARRIQSCVRDADSVARLGGDEFTVILPNINKSAPVTMVASKILHELSCPFELDEKESHLSASIGITLFPQDGDDSGTLLQNADTAMYRAKRNGSNHYNYFTWEMNKEAEDRVELELALRRSLQRDEFELYYQPILDASSGNLVGAEALLRWQCPARGQVQPGEFIALAEESGIIVPLGEWVLQRAAADLMQWDQAGLVLRNLSVNVSTVQFRATDFAKNMRKFMNSNPHLASRLNIEITENIFMDEWLEPGKQLKLFRELGVGIAIDDFGTGYSSLGYLKRFPVDTIKIDRSFVSDVTNDPEDAALCEAIIAMAHHLRIKVVAEGVETEQQLQFLRESGCDLVQGYLFSRPLPANEFMILLEKNIQREQAAS